MTVSLPLNSIERGSGVPLVLLHAFPLSGAMWAADAEQFASMARVIVPDLPGFGRSARQSEPSIAAMAHAVGGLLDALGIRQPVILAGLSMGGYVALECLRQFPHRVKALGLFATRAAADAPEQREGRLKLIERLTQDGLEALMHSTLPKLVGRTTASRRPDVMAAVERSVRTADREGVIDALRAMATRRDSTPVLLTIACPTLVIAGAEDALIPMSESEAMARRIPGARLEIIPQTGHLVNLEGPEAFQAIVAVWLRQLG